MIVEWVRYTIVIGVCAAVVAAAVEPLAASRGWPRRVVWVASLLVAVLVPVVTAVRPVAVPSNLPPVEALPSVAMAAAPAALAQWSAGRWLLVCWGVASGAMLAMLAWSAWQIGRLARKSRAVTLHGEVVALTDSAGPGARCFGTPRIMIPVSLAALDAARGALLVSHEREHVRAGDPALLMVSLGLLAAAPWNLALWFMARRLRLALELDCDARVLAAGGDVRTYGELLLTVAAVRRSPRLATYLAFAATPSSLERRIRTMTSRHPLGRRRTLLYGAVAAIAAVAACESRRPDPVAPVASYTIADGAVAPSPVRSPAEGDSIRRRLAAELHERVPGPTLNGQATDPLVMVYDDRGSLVMSGRLRARGANGVPLIDSLPFPSEAIATVDVIKSGALLPAEARGGLIRVTLKPTANLPMKRAMPSLRLAPDSGNLVSPASPSGGAATAIIFDSEGRELHRQVLRLAAERDAASPVGDLPVDAASIATVDVRRSPGGASAEATVYVTLKPGHGLRTRR